MKLFSLAAAIAVMAAMNFSTANADLVNFSFGEDGVGFVSGAQDAGDIFTSTDISLGSFTDGDGTQGISGSSFGPFARTADVITDGVDPLADALTNNTFVSFTVTNSTSDTYSLDNFTYDYGFSNGFPTLDANTVLFSSVDGFTSGAELGTNSIAVAGSGFSQTIDQTLRTVDVSSLGDIAPSESIEFRLYFVDNSDATNRIHRTSDFELTGTLVTATVPEPSSIALLGLGGVAMLIRRRK